MQMKNRIRQKLEKTFSPLSVLDVINESDNHQGHKGSPGTGESHFKIRLKSPAFNNLSRVTAHRLIYKSLDAEFKEGLHALSIEILT
ncbi:MAG: BolA family transcriptional regulator [Alphaproteobacteria bacterium]|nr:BolA family transcriptional regulator [Alphaproteobacteria bacterium]